jgi:Domain of unknown function (DUF4907)
MKALIILLILAQPVMAMSQSTSPAQKTGINNPQSKPDSLSYIIISNNKEYGYDIFRSGKLLIHQPHIPGLHGQHGFENKIDAEKVALRVISKLMKGIFPPAISEEEMKDLGIKINNDPCCDKANNE